MTSQTRPRLLNAIFPAMASLLLGLAGCAVSQPKAVARQELGSPLVTSVGSVILRLDKTSTRSGVLGALPLTDAPIDRGYTEVRLAQAETSSSFVLSVVDVDKGGGTSSIDKLGRLSSVPKKDTLINFNRVKLFAVSGFIIRFVSFDGVNLTYTVDRQ